MPNRPPQQGFFRYPLSTILASEGHVRILRELSRHGGELPVTALAQRTGLSKPGVRKALEALATSDAVSAVGSGKTVLYRIGPHPIMSAVGRLFEEEEKLYADATIALRDVVNRQDDVLAAWIYGSVARGEEGLGSDLDVVLVVNNSPDAVTEKVREAIAASRGPFAIPVSIIGLAAKEVLTLSKGDPWWSNVVSEARTLKGDRPEVLARKLASRRKDMTP